MPVPPRLEELRRRLEKESSSKLFAQLGEELRKAGEIEEAIQVLKDGLKKHPGYFSARISLGRALLDANQAEAALAELEIAQKAAPDNILGTRLLGEAAARLGDFERAIRFSRVALALAPGDKQLEAQIAEYETRRNAVLQTTATESDAEAEMTAPESLDDSFTDFDSSSAPLVAEQVEAPLVSEYRADDQDRQIVTETFSQSVTAPMKVEPVHAAAVTSSPAEAYGLKSPTLAEIYYQQGDFEKSMAMYRDLLAQNPQDEESRKRLAEIEHRAAEERQSRVSESENVADSSDKQARAQKTIAKLERLMACLQGAKAWQSS